MPSSTFTLLMPVQVAGGRVLIGSFYGSDFSTGFRAEASYNRFSPSFHRNSKWADGRTLVTSFGRKQAMHDLLAVATAVKNSIGACVKELSCERLRFCVTVGIVKEGECLIHTAHIMKGRVEVRHILAHL